MRPLPGLRSSASTMSTTLLLLLLHHPHPTTSTTPDPPCTITSPLTQNFFDLRPLALTNLTASPDQDYTSLGHDYPSNFTLNICAPVLSPLADKAIGVAPGTDVGGFYTLPRELGRRSTSGRRRGRRGGLGGSSGEQEGGEDDPQPEVDVYSLGSPSTTLLLRGRKLVLEYNSTGGSPCPIPQSPSSSSSLSSLLSSPPPQHKSTLLTFLCDPTLPVSTPPTINFLGSLSHCYYIFEIRTPHACPTYHDDSTAVLGPFAIFIVVLAVFAVVYCVGGCVYQRTVLNARGWRQVPHGGVWRAWGRWVVGVVGGLAGRLGRNGRSGGGGGARGGYRALGGYGGGVGRRRLGGGGGVGVGVGAAAGAGAGAAAVLGQGSDDEDDENRLLDQLDEEWDE